MGDAIGESRKVLTKKVTDEWALKKQLIKCTGVGKAIPLGLLFSLSIQLP